MTTFLYDRVADNENPASLSARYRRARFKLFLRVMQVSAESLILDVGGTEATWKGTGFERNVTLLNRGFQGKDEDFKYVEGDACGMHMMTNRSFDIVYANSVIEHVGSWQRQCALAQEVARVGKTYWIQTPNKHFPIEPHAVFPLFQYMPLTWQQFVATRWRYSHFVRNHEDVRRMLSDLRLLTKRELAMLFPDGKFIPERFIGLTKSLITYKT